MRERDEVVPVGPPGEETLPDLLFPSSTSYLSLNCQKCLVEAVTSETDTEHVSG